MSLVWNGKPRTIPIGSKVCVARVISLVETVEQQLRSIAPRFRWRAGHELHVAIVADGEIDIVLGFVFSRAGRAGVPVLGIENEEVRQKLIAATREQELRPIMPQAFTGDGRVRARR